MAELGAGKVGCRRREAWERGEFEHSAKLHIAESWNPAA